MQNDNIFENLFEGKIVESFLQQFVNTQYSSMPKNVEEVLQNVKNIWEEKGFITPAELKADLIKKYLGDDNNAVLLNLIDNIEVSRNSGEQVTGYLGREHSYLATGLAHLYSKTMNNDVAMIEIDFSNMGGTNEYFKQKLAEEQGISIDEVKAYKANLLTDKAALLISAKIVDVVINNLSAAGKIIPIRSGGDELRILFTDKENISDEFLKGLTDKIHSSVEGITAKLNLHDHKHHKDPTDPDKNGFGAAVTIVNMNTIDNPKGLIHRLDAEIKVWKKIIGKLRQGKIDEDFVREEIKQLINNGSLPCPNDNAEDFILQEIEKTKERTNVVANVLKSLKPQGDFTTADFEDLVAKELSILNLKYVREEPLKEEINVNKISDSDLSDIAPMSTLKARRKFLVENYLSNNGVRDLSMVQHYLLNIALDDLSTKDPSSGVLVPKEIITAIEASKKDISDFNKQTKSKEAFNPKVMGVSFHGLAILNDVFGHQAADVVLKYFAEEIIKESIRDSVANRELLEDSVYVAHHGGGNFSILLNPADLSGGKMVRSFSKDTIKEIEYRIEEKTRRFNADDIEDFFLSNGMKIERDLLKEKNIRRFYDLEDIKERKIFFGNKVFLKKIKGIHVATSNEEIIAGERRSAARIVSTLRNQTDENLDMLRAYISLKDEMSTPNKSKKLTNSFRG